MKERRRVNLTLSFTYKSNPGFVGVDVKLSRVACIMCHRGNVARWLIEDHMPGNSTVQYAIYPNHGYQTITANTSQLTSGHLTPHTTTLFFIMCRTKMSKRPTKFHVTPNMNLTQHSLTSKRGLTRRLAGQSDVIWRS